MSERKYQILPQEALKLLACITMFIDHFGATIVRTWSSPYMAKIYYLCRIIGRVSFPLYCFLLVEGMRHTRNTGKYILRLAVGILLAELPFDFLFEGGFSWESQSVMVTLALGAVMLWCMGQTEKAWLKVLLILPFSLLAEFTKCDYGAGGVAMIAAFALFDQLILQTVALFLVNWLRRSTAAVTVLGFAVRIKLMAVFAIIPIALYNGRKLTRNKVVQWGFYLFYPLHMLVLWVILGLIR